MIAGRTPAEAVRENIRLTTLALHDRVGITNQGFRTPGGFADGLADREDVQRMLLDLGFTWVSSKYPKHANSKPMEKPSAEMTKEIINAQFAAQPFAYPSGLLEIPMSPISDINAFRSGRWQLEWFLEAIRLAVTWAIEHKAVFDFLAHPSCLGVVDPKFRTLDLICDLVEQSQGQAILVDLETIANGMSR